MVVLGGGLVQAKHCTSSVKAGGHLDPFLHPIDSLLHPDAHLVKGVRNPLPVPRALLPHPAAPPSALALPQSFPAAPPDQSRTSSHRLRTPGFLLPISLASRSFLPERFTRPCVRPLSFSSPSRTEDF